MAEQRRAEDSWVTSGEGATLAGVTPSGFRTLIHRAKRAGVDVLAPRAEWPDGRTPLFRRRALEEYLESRPRAKGRAGE